MSPKQEQAQKEVSEEQSEESALAESRMTLGEHLNELRRRLFRGVLTIVVLFGVCYGFRDEVTTFVQRPFTHAMERLEPEFIAKALLVVEENEDREFTDYFLPGTEADPILRDFKKVLSSIQVAEFFLYQLKICFYVAVVLGSPILLWQMWQFIAAGLYRKEKRALLSYFPLSLFAFGAGIAFGYSVIVPEGLFYINQMVSVELGVPTTSASTYLGFLSSLCLAFGFIFQLPLILTFLGRMGLVDSKTLAKYRGEFLIGAFVIAAFLTPPEPFTQVMMGLPMVILYELGIIGARVAGKRRAEAEAAEEAELRR